MTFLFYRHPRPPHTTSPSGSDPRVYLFIDSRDKPENDEKRKNKPENDKKENKPENDTSFYVTLGFIPRVSEAMAHCFIRFSGQARE